MTNEDIRAQLAIARGALEAIDAGLSAPPAAVISVTAGQSLQAAIETAVAAGGGTIEAEAGMYPSFQLRGRIGGGVITIRPKGWQQATGVRVAAQTPVVIAPSTTVGIGCDLGASGYLLQGLSVSSPGINGTMIALANQAMRVEDLPTGIALVGCWLDGGNACKRGVDAGGAGITILDSRIFGVFKVGQDTQAIGGAQGCGPFGIDNNYLSASTETLMFGGDDPRIAGLIPSDITITRNTLTKDPAWQATKLTVKNTLELKNAQRVLIEGNIIERSWQDGQVGFLVVFGVRNQSGGAPWSTVRDVEMRYNVCRHGNQGLELLGLDDIKDSAGVMRPSARMQHINIHDNLFYDLAAAGYGVGSKFAMFVNNGPIDARLVHNTFSGPVSVGLALSSGPSKVPAAGLIVRDSIIPEGGYGIKADAVVEGLPSWTACVDAASVFDSNQIVKTQMARTVKYPGTMNMVGPVMFDAGFVAAPPMLGSDGAPVGCDLAKIRALLPGLDMSA